MPRPYDSTEDPTPRYSKLASLFRQRIDNGVWAPQSRIPSLESLMAEFDVARVTVRQAVGLLSREGLLRAERGRGTFVTSLPPMAKPLRLQTSLAAIAAMYRDDKPLLTLIEETESAPRLHPDDGVPALRYRHLRRVHSRDGDPYCVISIYLAEDVFRLAPRRFRRETVIPVLLDLPAVKIGSAAQSLRIASADTELTRLLGIPLHAAIAHVRRVVVDADGRVIYLGEVNYRGDAIHFEMDLTV